MQTRSKFRWLLALCTAMMLLAAACGGSDGANTATGSADEGAEASDDDAMADNDEDHSDGAMADGDGASDGDAMGEPIKVGIVYDIGGRGDQSFNDSAFAGLDRAATELKIDAKDLEPNEGGENREELLRLLADENGSDLVIGVGFLFEGAIAAVAADFPDTKFGVVDGFVDPGESPNVASMRFTEHEGSFLVGAAAALKSTSNKIGFIGGVEFDLIQKFEAGYVAGAKHINPDIEVDIKYITQPPDFDGFGLPDKAKEIALAQYGGGADIVYHAAGGSGAGLFEAAKEVSGSGDKVWAIGVDSDQYLTADPAVQEFILTSMMKRVDNAVFETIAAANDGSFAGGPRAFDLSVDGVGYSTSGGYVDDIVSKLDGLKQEIIDGAITVPTAP